VPDSSPLAGQTGCPRCWPGDPALAWEGRRGLALVHELVDESHFRITLRACPACSQHFIAAFVEDVDWADGDDPQYWSMMPLRMEESIRLVVLPAAELIRQLGLLSTDRRCLHRNAPKGAPASVAWRDGLRLE
jgi:hypothetical protein